MKHEEKKIVAVIIGIAICLIIMGAVLGFTIGRISAAVKPAEPDIEPIETTEIISIETPEATPQPTPSPTKVYYDCPLSEELQDYIHTLCEENEIPMALVIAQIQEESKFRSDAISETNDYGLMQINKINHEWLEEEYGITDFFDPFQNVFCGIKILSEHYSKYGDMDKALMAYNMGESGAKKLWNNGIYSTSYVKKIRNAMDELQIKEANENDRL